MLNKQTVRYLNSAQRQLYQQRLEELKKDLNDLNKQVSIGAWYSYSYYGGNVGTAIAVAIQCDLKRQIHEIEIKLAEEK